MTTRINAKVERGQRWWIAFFDVDGHQCGTQAKRIDQLEPMILDAASLMAGRPVSDFTVDITVADAKYVGLVDEYKARARAAAEAEEAVARASREAVSTMRRDGLPMRDIATLMGISPQRVSQLART
ncbi:hypothetical protein [Actinomyces culturomici]|uniref:hypothetical protein n=1 Tax=Actinomyces culturomici TaxID=1926276 RepID=UPI000E200A83|nr:hypothetical protein [Actinomyces culturomici]